LKEMLIGQLAQAVGCTPEDIRQVLAPEVGAVSGTGRGPTAESDSLDSQEWRAFITPQSDQDERDRFITRHVPFLGSQDRVEFPEAIRLLDTLIPQVVLATRLREVRALVGFERYEQGGPKPIPPSLNEPLRWLPAIEVFGEGVFIRLDETALSRWEI